MTKNFYALAIRASGQVNDVSVQQMKAAVTQAHSGNEALGIGVEIAQSTWPLKKGWVNHDAAYCEVKQSTCAWKYDDVDDFWETACGGTFWLADGTPADNGMRFCPYCGGRLTVAASNVDEEDETEMLDSDYASWDEEHG